MFGLQAQLRGHEDRIAALESRTVSGVPDLTIADRFTALHERMDDVGRNVLTKIDKRASELKVRIDSLDARAERIEVRTERLEVRADELVEQMHQFQLATDDGFRQVNREVASMGLRLDKVHVRLDQQDSRFDRFEASIAKRFTDVDDKFASVDDQFGQMRSELGEVKGELADIKSMLLSMGASAPDKQVN